MRKMETRVEDVSIVIITSAAAAFAARAKALSCFKKIYNMICVILALFKLIFILSLFSWTLVSSFPNVVTHADLYWIPKSKVCINIIIMYIAKRNCERSRENCSSIADKLFLKFWQSFLTTAFCATQNNLFLMFIEDETQIVSDGISAGPLSPENFSRRCNAIYKDTSSAVGRFVKQPFRFKPVFVGVKNWQTALIRSMRQNQDE